MMTESLNAPEQVQEEEVQDTSTVSAEDLDIFGMSDEEFLKAEEAGELSSFASDEVEDLSEGDVEASQDSSEEALYEEEADTQNNEENLSEDKSEASEDTNVEFSKEDAYDELMSEFKANGKMMTVGSVEEARQLMQMGANYHKKMNEMGKDRKFIQMLKDNDLLDTDKINYLIDISKKDAGAIKKLLKESEVDPLDLDLESENSYTPNTYEANEAQVQLDETLESLQDSEGFSTTMDIITSKWDGKSKVALAQNPSDIALLNSHVESGVYEMVNSEVERQRTFGKLSGVSDFEAYKIVGDELYKKQLENQKAAEKKVSLKLKDDKKDTAANEKRKAAAPTKGQSRLKENRVKSNPLAMSDEDFIKAFGE